MASLNRAILIGRLGADPVMHPIQSGGQVANLSIATTETWKTKDGERKEHTEWHRCAAYGKIADFAGEYLKKGALVAVEGKIRTRKWASKDGEEQFTTEIIIDNLQALSKPRTENRPDPKFVEDYKKGEGIGADDDIPF